MSTNNTLLSVGLLGYLGGAAIFMRWLRRAVPPSERRQATLQPRFIDDYVPRWFRRLVHVAVVAHLATWLIVGATDRLRNSAFRPDFWPAFAGILVMTILLFVLCRASVMRRPTVMDKSSGFDYRRAEIRVAFAIQLVVVGFGVMGLCKLLYDIDLQRVGTLGFTVFFAVTLYSLTRPHRGGASLVIRAGLNYLGGATAGPGHPNVRRPCRRRSATGQTSWWCRSWSDPWGPSTRAA